MTLNAAQVNLLPEGLMTLQHVRALNLIAMLAAVAVVACGDDDSNGPTIVTETFRATLNGPNEKPDARVSTGVGAGTVVIFGSAADSISYDLKIGLIDSVTLSHIHAGDVNSAGSIIFGFPATVPPTSFPTANTQFQAGMIRRTGSTFSGIFTFDSLVTRLRAGTAYMNVHTRKYGGGEIRGNLIKQ
jgi:hypothetical protein